MKYSAFMFLLVSACVPLSAANDFAFRGKNKVRPENVDKLVYLVAEELTNARITQQLATARERILATHLVIRGETGPRFRCLGQEVEACLEEGHILRVVVGPNVCAENERLLWGIFTATACATRYVLPAVTAFGQQTVSTEAACNWYKDAKWLDAYVAAAVRNRLDCIDGSVR